MSDRKIGAWACLVFAAISLPVACASGDNENTGTGGSAGAGGDDGGGACVGVADCLDCNDNFVGGAVCENGRWKCPPRDCGTGGVGGRSDGGAGPGGAGNGGTGEGGSGGAADCSHVTFDANHVAEVNQTLEAFCAHEDCPASLDEAIASFLRGTVFTTYSFGCGYTSIDAEAEAFARRYYYDDQSGELIAAYVIDDVPEPPCDEFAYVGGEIPAACTSAESCVVAAREFAMTVEQAALPWCDGFGGQGGAGGSSSGGNAGSGGQNEGGAGNGTSGGAGGTG